MTSDRLARIRELFEKAVEIDPAGRGAFLADACGGDQSLVEEVESLLEAHGQASGFLDRPAWMEFHQAGTVAGEGGEDLVAEPGLPFERLGEFRLISRIGEGGMGVVYLAVQESLGRRVALKVIRPERMGSFEAETRFWRESEAVSALRHPNIVTVFGSGEDQGVRYFAMELVPGKGLDAVLLEAAQRGERLPTPKVLGWIMEAAQALGCAHGAGIIHRDVKPSNIQITPDDHAMLMDFGVARHMNLSTLTLTGEFRGTPNYSSPEQVEARRQKIDARTDVYSLGATLYEAVTGKVPFEGETTEQVFHQILEKDPPAPRRLNPAISRDLETVIVTAMEKEPGRRYQAMDDFSGDLQRVLNGEMILAKPAGFATRAWKGVKRHPVTATAVGVTLLSIVGFVLYVLLWSYPQIIKERDAAEEQRRAAIVARAETEREYEKTRAVNDFLHLMLSSADPDESGKDVKVADILDGATARLDQAFEGQPEVEASLRNTISRTYSSLGLYEPAEKQAVAAVEISRRISGEEHLDTLAFTNNLANVYKNLGRYGEAESLLERVLETYRKKMGEEHPTTLTAMHNLALALQNQEKFADAERLYVQALEGRRRVEGGDTPDTLLTMNNLALLYKDHGRYSDAEVLMSQVLETKRRLLRQDHPSILKTMNNLAIVYKNQGRYSDAEPLLRELIEIMQSVMGHEHPATLAAMHNLAGVLDGQGRSAEAQSLFEETLQARARVLGDKHPEVLSTMSCLADVLEDQGKFAEAEEYLTTVLEELRRSRGPESPLLLPPMNLLADVLVNQERYSEARALFLQGLEIAGKTLPPGHPTHAVFHTNYGDCLRREKRFEEAEAHLLQGLAGFRSVMGEEHPNTRAVLAMLIELYEDWGKPEKAKELRADGE